MIFPAFRRSLCAKATSVVLVATFMVSNIPCSFASQGSVLGLPQPGTMVNLSPSYAPLMITGLTIHPENPLLMDFIVNTGDSAATDSAQIKEESSRLIKYFLACLTIPEGHQWVNLSPYENRRIIPDDLGQTVLGQDMLAQDYILKQLTASLIYPEKNLGKEFWEKVYAKAAQEYGTTQIPVNTFNKVWIIPEYANVYEHDNTVIVVKSHLKVMLDADYLSLQKHSVILSEVKDLNKINSLRDSSATPQNDVNNLGNQIIREIVLPAIENEVNTGKNFAELRQIYNSLILAVWFKKNLKEALLNQVYTGKTKLSGVNADDPAIKEKIYQQYLEAYKKGVFNYIREETDQATQQSVPRKYFSGGIMVPNSAMIHQEPSADLGRDFVWKGQNYIEKGRTQIAGNSEDSAMAPIPKAEDFRYIFLKFIASAFVFDNDRRKMLFLYDGNTRRQEALDSIRSEMVEANGLEADEFTPKTPTKELRKYRFGILASSLTPEKIEQVKRWLVNKMGQLSSSVMMTVIDNGGIVLSQADVEEFLQGMHEGRNDIAIIKPDAVGKVDFVVDTLKAKGYKVRVSNLITLTAEQVREFYRIHQHKAFFDKQLLPYMTEGPVYILLIEGPDNNTIDNFRVIAEKILRPALGGTPEDKVHTKIHAPDKKDIAEGFGPEYEAKVLLEILKVISKPTWSEMMFESPVAPGVAPNIHQGKTVLITGGAGYVASGVLYELLQNGSNVVIYDNMLTPKRRAFLKAVQEHYPDRVKVIEADLDSKESLKNALLNDGNRVNGVVHLGAYIASGVSGNLPATYYQNNVVNTMNLLDAMDETGVKNLVFASSAGVFEGTKFNEHGLLDEKTPVNPQNPYGETKYLMEVLMKAYADKHGINYAALRFFNLAGAFYWGEIGQWVGEAHLGPETHLIPRLIKYYLYGKEKVPFKIFGNDYPTEDGTNVRDYIHVLDISHAILKSLSLTYEAEMSGQQVKETYTLGTGTPTSNNQIVEAFRRVLPEAERSKLVVEYGPRRLGDPPLLRASSEKATRELAWQGMRDLDEIVKSAYEFHKREQEEGSLNLDEPLPEENTGYTEADARSKVLLDIMANTTLTDEIKAEILLRLLVRSINPQMAGMQNEFKGDQNQLNGLYKSITEKQESFFDLISTEGFSNALWKKPGKVDALINFVRANAQAKKFGDDLNTHSRLQIAQTLEELVQKIEQSPAMMVHQMISTFIKSQKDFSEGQLKAENSLRSLPGYSYSYVEGVANVHGYIQQLQELGWRFYKKTQDLMNLDIPGQYYGVVLFNMGIGEAGRVSLPEDVAAFTPRALHIIYDNVHQIIYLVYIPQGWQPSYASQKPAGVQPPVFASKAMRVFTNADLEHREYRLPHDVGVRVEYLTRVSGKIMPHNGVSQRSQRAIYRNQAHREIREGGIDLNSKNLNLQSSGNKVNITFNSAMMAQFRRGDFSGVNIKILDVEPINLMPLLGLKEEPTQLALR